MKNLYMNMAEFWALFRSDLTTTYANWKVGPTKEELHAHNKTDRILLTFDDYADGSRVESILKILKDENIKAIFFLIGEWASENPHIVSKIKKAGHWIGNHTKTHKNLLQLSDNEVRDEILKGPPSTLLRPPYGRYNKKIRNIANNLGYKICYWDIDSDDWKGIDSNNIKNRIFRNLHSKACILMHLNGQHTLEVLPSLIKGIRKQGYEFCYDGMEIEL